MIHCLHSILCNRLITGSSRGIDLIQALIGESLYDIEIFICVISVSMGLASFPVEFTLRLTSGNAFSEMLCYPDLK